MGWWGLIQPGEVKDIRGIRKISGWRPEVTIDGGS